MLRMVVSIQLLLLMLYLHQKRRKPRARVPTASGTRSISYDYARRLRRDKLVPHLMALVIFQIMQLTF